jgi:hypothetical protein
MRVEEMKSPLFLGSTVAGCVENEKRSVDFVAGGEEWHPVRIKRIRTNTTLLMKEKVSPFRLDLSKYEFFYKVEGK